MHLALGPRVDYGAFFAFTGYPATRHALQSTAPSSRVRRDRCGSSDWGRIIPMNKPHNVRTLRPQPSVSDLNWPAELGIASTSGSSAEMRYAYFPKNRRLAVEWRGVVTIYDTAEYQFRGMLQAHSAETVGMSILTQRGRVPLTELATVLVPAPPV